MEVVPKDLAVNYSLFSVRLPSICQRPRASSQENASVTNVTLIWVLKKNTHMKQLAYRTKEDEIVCHLPSKTRCHDDKLFGTEVPGARHWHRSKNQPKHLTAFCSGSA